MDRKRTAVAAVLLTALAAAGSASAAGEPSALGDARVGRLSVTSGVIVGERNVDLRGVWNDPTLPCRARRTLRVKAQVEYVPARGRPRRVVRTASFPTENCAEGGPNMGFTLSARALGLACPDGRWRPARYAFVATTLEPARDVRAVGSLTWEKTGRCY